MLTLVLMPRVGKAQSAQPDPQQKKPVVSLGQNYPNPFNPESRIPFTLGDYPTCSDGGKQYRVTLKIFNLLAQVVAYPLLEGSSGGVAGGQRLENVLLPCGQYTAYWNGKYLGTSKEAASGVYYWQIIADGQSQIRRSLVAK
ncbi:MAG: hypothetical protein U9Q74_14105 [Gemmatimonadota bacterium]|nr:hypothetical protein [Gemmatimonadota bacterium]